MADELSLRVIATTSQDVVPDRFDETATLDNATALVEAGGQTVGTTHEALDLGDVSTARIVILKNPDSANYVEVGRVISASFEAFSTIEAGSINVVKPSSGATLYVKANGSPVTIQKFIPST
jgi:hypothetical protein